VLPRPVDGGRIGPGWARAARVGYPVIVRGLTSSLVAALGLVGGFALARSTGRREVGGALFAAAGAWSARQWHRSSGPAAALGLGTLYAAAMGGSHPLAKRIGAWPAVAAVTALTVGASQAVTRLVTRR